MVRYGRHRKGSAEKMASGNFVKCLPFTLRYEGGKVNNPHDPGGRTNKGVTQRTYDIWRAKHNLPLNDVYNILDKEVEAIYKHEYWDEAGCEYQPAGVDLCLFDFAVNSGPRRAKLRLVGAKSCIPATSPDYLVIDAYCASRLSFLRNLSTWSHFGRGWKTRVEACEVEALRMAGMKKEKGKYYAIGRN